MSMLADAITKFREICNSGHIKEILDMPTGKVYLNTMTGEDYLIEKDHPPISATVKDFDSLTNFLAAISNLQDPSKLAIFISEANIVAIADYNGGYRTKRATMPLSVSPIHTYLKTPIKGDVKTVLTSLRFNLSAGCTLAPEDLREKLSHLKFEQASEATHTVKPRDEGVSRSMKAKVSNPDDSEIPDSAVVCYSMYPDLGHLLGSASVRLHIQIDPTEGTILIRPFPGELDAAVTRSLSNIRGALCDMLPDSVGERVFLGTP